MEVDPSRQEEWRLINQEGLPSGESLKLLSEISAWSHISNGKTLADFSEHHGQSTEDVVTVPEDLNAALRMCRESAMSYIAQGRISVPPAMIIDYNSITDYDAFRATEEKTQEAVAYALGSGLRRATTANGTSAADDKSQGSNDDAK
ncbi:hypothetical protein B9479_004287 [Cryptococcus floricola]|uniref:Uncharacterized protein n=1 Tax=Cryptococcus floricola TaxID=2591691 RepID=A0A5D3AYA6_9TREE|nr:hypothetical protein B9479_004287 [Cryptococcus floricola]